MSYAQHVGKRIKLTAMPEEPNPLPIGSEGTIVSVSRICMDAKPWWQIVVKWDNGSPLMLCVPPDRYQLID